MIKHHLQKCLALVATLVIFNPFHYTHTNAAGYDQQLASELNTFLQVWSDCFDPCGDYSSVENDIVFIIDGALDKVCESDSKWANSRYSYSNEQPLPALKEIISTFEALTKEEFSLLLQNVKPNIETIIGTAFVQLLAFYLNNFSYPYQLHSSKIVGQHLTPLYPNDTHINKLRNIVYNTLRPLLIVALCAFKKDMIAQYRKKLLAFKKENKNCELIETFLSQIRYSLNDDPIIEYCESKPSLFDTEWGSIASRMITFLNSDALSEPQTPKTTHKPSPATQRLSDLQRPVHCSPIPTASTNTRTSSNSTKQKHFFVETCLTYPGTATLASLLFLGTCFGFFLKKA